MKKYRIALDCMGFENKPEEAIFAAIEFSKKYSNIEFVLFGDEKIINSYINKYQLKNFYCFPTSEIITMNDTPITARFLTNSSMYKAIESTSTGDTDAVLSAGSSGVYIALTYSMLGKINNLVKPGFMSWLPTIDKKGFYFLDVGANKIFTGAELYNLGLLANQFVMSYCLIKKPRIALLNIGTEEFKGFEYHKVANQLFKQNLNLNYLGFVESRYLLEGICDILISDGYSGNLVLKSLEGSFKVFAKILKKGYKKNILAGLFSLGIIHKISKTFDYKNNAGAMLLGLNKLAIKTHGSADYKQFYSSLRMTYEILKSDLMNKMKNIKNFA